jgi:hypothetical protein
MPRAFDEDMDGTRKKYGIGLRIESLSGPPFSGTMWRRSLWSRRARRPGEDWELCPRIPPLGGEGGEVVARILVRVGACADELTLMVVERKVVLSGLAIASGDWNFVVKNDSKARAPPSMERM